MKTLVCSAEVEIVAELWLRRQMFPKCESSSAKPGETVSVVEKNFAHRT